MPKHETWGDLPAHEIAARIMAQERAMLYEPSHLLPPAPAPSPIRPIRPISPIPIPPTIMDTPITISPAGQIRQAIAKYAGQVFTLDALHEDLRSISRVRLNSTIPAWVSKGWIEHVPGTSKPAKYKQVRPFSEKPLLRSTVRRKTPTPTVDKPAPTSVSVASAPRQPRAMPPEQRAADARIDRNLQTLIAGLQDELHRTETRAAQIRAAIDALS